ncbi:MAG: hypothetical protein KDB61_09235 [Planctomycetes bacterium]|nr:hypothetical protein [Planctomycetota bacterium]
MLEPTGTLEVHAEMQRPEGSDESDFESGLDLPIVHLSSLEPDLEDPSWHLRSTSLKYLVPGEYDLKVTGRNHTPVFQRVRIEAGITSHLRVNLELTPEVQPLHAEVRSKSGKRVERFEVILQLEDHFEGTWCAVYNADVVTCGVDPDYSVVYSETQSPDKVTFDIERIPRGTLKVRTQADEFACDSQLTEDADGSLKLEVTILDLPADK